MADRDRTLVGRHPASGALIRVHLAHRRIRLIEPVRSRPADETPWIWPGLIDLQVNGFRGLDVNAESCSADTVAGLVAVLQAAGVTTLVPTLVSAPEEQILHGLRVIADARDADAAIRHAIPYVHLEGPHLSDQDGPRGAHDARWIRPPSVAEYRRWQRAGRGIVGMVTLSPHYPTAARYIRALRGDAVQVAIGHTHATPSQVADAATAGATLCTHLGNAAHLMLPRHPNYLWAQLADDRLCASFIADGHHLPADTLTVMLRAKGLRRSLLVSDSVALAGMPPGRYHTSVGDRVTLRADGGLYVTGTRYLAGAVRSLADDVAVAADLTGLPLNHVLALASTNPARFLPNTAVPRRGRLTAGACADLIRFHWHPSADSLRVEEVITVV